MLTQQVLEVLEDLEYPQKLSRVSRWEKANRTDHRSIDEVFMRDVDILDVYQFVSLLGLGFLLQYPRKVSLINTKVDGGR